jgi:hypothetical protein
MTRSEQMLGELAILNVGAGDTKLTFNPDNPAEVERSGGIVRDMIRRGFVLLVEIGRNEKGPIYQRAHDFDPETCEYIVAGSATPEESNEQAEQIAAPPAKGRAPARRKAGARRIPAATSRAVAVARTSGG